MAPLASALSNLIQSFTSIVASLVNSVLAVLQAILALGGDLLNGLLQLVQAFVAFGTDLFGSALAFVAGECFVAVPAGRQLIGECPAHFVAILLIGGAYYYYTNYTDQGGRARSSRKIR